MPSTYSQIATNTLGSTATSVTFSSIPQTYTNLVVIFNGTGVSGDTLYYQYNNNTSAIYSDTYMFADGTAGSGRHTNQGAIFGTGVNSTNTTNIIHIAQYANTTTFKTSLLRGGANGTAAAAAFVGLWRSTDAINSIKLNLNVGFAAGSVFSLYGIKGA